MPYVVLRRRGGRAVVVLQHESATVGSRAENREQRQKPAHDPVVPTEGWKSGTRRSSQPLRSTATSDGGVITIARPLGRGLRDT